MPVSIRYLVDLLLFSCRFKEDLSGFDDVELPDATLQVLRPYVNKPHFAPGYLSTRTGNTAIGSLVLYVRGVVR